MLTADKTNKSDVTTNTLLQQTLFQKNPTTEKKLLDPFSTFDLSILSKPELAIDKIYDAIDDFLPKELVDTLKNNKWLKGKVAELGTTITSYIGKIANKLPGNIDVTNLLRNVNIESIGKNLDRAISAVGGSGILSTLNKDFMTDTLNGMDSFSEITNMDNFGSLVDNGGAFFKDVVAEGGVLLADIKNTVTNSPTASKFLDTLGIHGIGDVLPAIQHLDSFDFNKVIGMTKDNKAAFCLDVLDTVKSYGGDSILSFINDYVKLDDKTVLNAISSGVDSLGHLATKTIGNIAANNKNGVATFLNSINLNGAQAYIDAATSNDPFTPIANLMVTNGIPLVTSALNSLTPFTTNDLNTSITQLDSVGIDGLNAINGQLQVVTPDVLGSYITVVGVNINIVYDATLGLETLSDSDVTSIANYLTNKDVTLAINNSSLEGKWKEFVVNKALHIASNNGDYITAYSLISKSGVFISEETKLNVVKEIIQNFKLDTTIVSLQTQSDVFLQYLNLIYNGWLYIGLDINQYMLNGASADSLTLFKLNIETFVPAVAQEDYTL